MKNKSKVIIGIFVVCVLAGGATGYLLSDKKGSLGGSGKTVVQTGGATGKTFGVTNTKEYPDTAIGTIEKDGISGEGTQKLIRDGGPSQTACLLSSTLDLTDFIGKKVKVWGKTEAAKSCPWLMDVGRVELQ